MDNKNETVIRNQIEEALKPVTSNNISGSDMFLMEYSEIQKEKLEVLKKFVSDGIQKTEINVGERKLLPSLFLMAQNPFPSITKKYKDSHPEILKDLELQGLSEYLDKYMVLGVPVGRKGRKEEVQILQSLFHNDSEIKINKDGSYAPKKFME